MSPPDLFDVAVNTSAFGRDPAADGSDVRARARAAGVTAVLVLGTDLDDSAVAIGLARAHPDFCLSTAGIHPHQARHAPPDLQARLEALLAAPEVRAVGETGLDFARDHAPRADQERVFEAQLELAADLRRGVLVHDRDTEGRTATLLARWRHRLPWAVVHCFTGDGEDLARWRDLDVHLGITGWICDERRGLALRELVTRIPEHRLLIETDSPYLAPRNVRPRPRRNEPALLPHVLAMVARCRETPEARVAEATRANAERCFGRPGGAVPGA